MDKELNNYHIKNPDGADKTVRNNGKQSYLNDNPHFIKEDSLKGQSEWDNSVSEGYFGFEKEQVENADISTKNDGISSSSVSSSAVSSGASSAAVSSAIGGSVGALAGTVAASVMAAVVVVAVFVSTLTINLSLLMASMTSLTFQVEMSGAQEEDFVKPIIAVLTGDDGVYLEQEIKQDSLFLTFDDLEAGKEYLITVKNEEKVFYSKSYFTATEEVEKGFVETYIEGDEVFAVVSQVNLSSGEYYTLTVKDDKGNTVFVKDDAKQFAEYGFKIPDAKKLLISFAVNGKVYSVSELEIEKDVDPPFTPEYDFSNPVWTWDSDFGAATASFTEIHGGEPLTLNATVMSNTTEATCEKDGFTSYTATVNYEGIPYYDYKEEIIPALGHEYGEPEFTWVQNATGGYTATATFVCLHDSGHTFDLPAIVTSETTEPTCEGIGFISYTATVTDEDKTYTDFKQEIIPALEHEYGDLISENYNGNGLAAHYECSVCHKLFDENKVETTEEELVITEESADGYISLNDGNICIDPNGYARSANNDGSLINPTPFVSSATNPYLIKDQEISWCDNIIQVYQNNSNLATADIYIKLSNVRLEAGSWCSLFMIKATQTVNIHLIIEGEVTFVGGSGQQVFSSQGSGAPTVHIIIDQTSFGGHFNVQVSDGLTHADSGSIDVTYQ